MRAPESYPNGYCATDGIINWKMQVDRLDAMHGQKSARSTRTTQRLDDDHDRKRRYDRCHKGMQTQAHVHI